MQFGPKKKKESGSPVVGQLRKTQLVTTFGSGAIVDMPNYSVIIAGTNYWSQDCQHLHEPNLERLLQVSHFKEPYVSEDQDGRPAPDTPAFRFPYFHFCPECGRLMPFWGFDQETGHTCSHGHPKRNIVPSRFVVACNNGHLEDFPYDWWVHRGDFSKCPPDKHRDNLKIRFSDETGGLDSIIITCTVCGAKRSMAGSMSKDALKGYHCHGRRPWIGRKAEKNDPVPCDAQLRVLQRGASNVYFPITTSALTIPPWSSKIQQEISSSWDDLVSFMALNPNPDNLKVALSLKFVNLLASNVCTLDELADEVMKRYQGAPQGIYKKQNLLEDEYRVFCAGDYDKPDDLQFRISETDVPEFLSPFVDKIILAKRLREVLALKGFRRISPEQPNPSDEKFKGYHLDGDCVPLSDVPMNWLPGIELLGEGIFIKLNEEELIRWENSFQDEYIPMATRLKDSNVGCENFSARYVLLHTLSHLLIRQLSLECGYSGSSIKERIYSTYPGSGISMAGILLYTSSSDSDGSLGGLVRQGLPAPFERIFRNMLQDASWCSSDPICIESHAQGYDSLNYAACHACALLPETSCEMRNCLLDRAAVTGTPQDRTRGFFGALLT